MPSLQDVVAQEVDDWRRDKYSSPYPALGEILEWAAAASDDQHRYLRAPQLQALETYWWLRVKKQTPLIPALYSEMFPTMTERLTALGLNFEAARSHVMDNGYDNLIQKIRDDNEFASLYRLDALRESLNLTYPSYIFALAMGAGKTVVMGSIIATEFVLANEYPNESFVENALVFAPGKTILQSLREFYEIPYRQIVPPRYCDRLLASMRIVFTKDGEPDIPVINGSSFNVVVTNTEKIRIQKERIRANDLGALFPTAGDAAKGEFANRRLQTIASLPSLGVFSDEAHHTYGNALDSSLKQVRKTVDYLAAKTSLRCVVNTTGTPYFQRQMLRDVVVWYGLHQGIRDNILKSVNEGIVDLQLNDTSQFVDYAIRDFFLRYQDVALPDGTLAKIAIYFPQIPDLRAARPTIEATLLELGIDPARTCLENTSESTEAEVEAFNRLNQATATHRVILLVNKGTEGWNCPSLFATALARKLKSSNNFVLQAASRCLRQVTGNQTNARIYLTSENRRVLDRQLQETFSSTLSQLNRDDRERLTARLVLRRTDLAPVTLRKWTTRVVRKAFESDDLKLTRPATSKSQSGYVTTYSPDAPSSARGVLQATHAERVQIEADELDIYTAAVELATPYRLASRTLLRALRNAYGAELVPVDDLRNLRQQVEAATSAYLVEKEEIEVALAVVKPQGFRLEKAADGSEVYYTEIMYLKDRAPLLMDWQDFDQRGASLGFHYSPYNFDSEPEVSFYTQLIALAGQAPDNVEMILFTGGLTDPGKTDFYVEYRGRDDRWRRYTPDFLVKTKDGRITIVEVKAAGREDDVVDGRHGAKARALQELQRLDPERLRYEMVFVKDSAVPANVIHDRYKDWTR